MSPPGIESLRVAIDDVLVHVRADDRFRLCRENAREIVVVEDVASDVDALGLFQIRVDDFYTARFERPKNLLVDVGLFLFAVGLGRRAEIERRRNVLRIETRAQEGFEINAHDIQSKAQRCSSPLVGEGSRAGPVGCLDVGEGCGRFPCEGAPPLIRQLR